MVLSVFLLGCFLIFISDIKYRKIPNVLLVGLFILRLISIIANFDPILLLDSVFGLLFAFFVFILPKFMKMKLGWGDVKYSAVLGFSLGFVDYICSMLLSVIFVFIYCAVRKVLLKKDIKDFSLPLGSFMSAGVIFLCVMEFILQTLHL